MRTLLLALILVAITTSAQAGYQAMSLLSDRGTVCIGDSLTAAEVCTVDVFLQYNVPWGSAAVSVYLDSINGTTTSGFTATALYFPERTITGDLTPGDSTKTISVRLDTLLRSHGSAPIPIAWRLTTGAVDTTIDWIDSGYYTSYVENADAGTAADQFSPNTGGMMRFFITQSTAFRFLFCVSYFRQ